METSVVWSTTPFKEEKQVGKGVQSQVFSPLAVGLLKKGVYIGGLLDQ